MMVRRRSGLRPVQSVETDLVRALEAMTAPELRAFVRGVLDELSRATRSRYRLVDDPCSQGLEAESSVFPNRQRCQIIRGRRSTGGHANPDDVSEHLRLASKAFLAGDHASARAVFEALLIPLSTADIDLGQHELVDDVLSVDVHACVAQYVTSVYTTTPLSDRAGAVFKAIEKVKPVGSVLNPIGEMEGVSAGTLPDLGAFLPRW